MDFPETVATFPVGQRFMSSPVCISQLRHTKSPTQLYQRDLSARLKRTERKADHKKSHVVTMQDVLQLKYAVRIRIQNESNR